MPQVVQRSDGAVDPGTERRRALAARVVWIVGLLVFTVVVVAQNERRSVTGVYAGAARALAAGRPLYESGIDGFLYLPVSALLYQPFTWLPGLFGGLAWRWLGVGLFATGLFRLAGLGGPRRGSWFLLLTLLTLPALAGCARNGQASAHIAGLLVHGAVDLGLGRFWRSAASLALAVAVKPIALPMALLVAALRPPAGWRVVLLLAGTVLVPVLVAPADYLLAQYGAFAEKLRVAATPPAGRWEDLTAVTYAAGLEPAPDWMTLLRGLAAVGTLSAGWLGLRRFGERRGALVLLALGAFYILLFSPRTEGGTYVLGTPAAAAFAAGAFERDARSRAGWLCAGFALLLGLSHALTHHPVRWLNPAASVVFVGYLVAVATGSTREAAQDDAAPLGSPRPARPPAA